MDNHIKVNYYAALKSNESRVGIGVVIGDNQSELLVSLCCPKGSINDHLIVELHALWQAMC